MSRRPPYASLRTAAWMAIVSAVTAFIVVSVGEAAAHSRKGRGTRIGSDAPVVTLASTSPETPAGLSRSVRVVYPAVVVAR